MKFKEIERKWGKGAIVRGVQDAAIVTDRLPTGSLGLDCALRGGYVRGHITVLWGPPGSGKNFLVCKAMSQSKRSALISTEGAIDPAWYRDCGVDVDTLDIAQPVSLEEATQVARTLTASGDYEVVAVDSLVGISDLAEVEHSMDEDQYSKIPRLLNRFARALQSSLQPKRGDKGLQPNRTTVLLTNQTREKVGKVLYDNEFYSGGRGIKHGNHGEIRLRRAGDITVEAQDIRRKYDGSIETYTYKKPIGQVVAWNVSHTKFCTPGGYGSFSMYFDGEMRGAIDTADEIARFGVLTGVIQSRGAYYGVGEGLIQGREALIQHIRALPRDAQSALAEKIRSA